MAAAVSQIWTNKAASLRLQGDGQRQNVYFIRREVLVPNPSANSCALLRWSSADPPPSPHLHGATLFPSALICSKLVGPLCVFFPSLCLHVCVCLGFCAHAALSFQPTKASTTKEGVFLESVLFSVRVGGKLAVDRLITVTSGEIYLGMWRCAGSGRGRKTNTDTSFTIWNEHTRAHFTVSQSHICHLKVGLSNKYRPGSLKC